MSIPESEWRWFGHAGHFVCASRCQFHLHTRVGDYRISTVGDMYMQRDDREPTEVGADRLFETYVFKLDGECRCEHDCGQGEISDFLEIDSLPANDFRTAERNHMTMCRKYAEAIS